MRVALFSDVHGNLTALEAVLNELDKSGPFDLTICAGDLVFLGPSPAEVVSRLQGSDIVCLRGNCDGMAAGLIPQELPPDEAVRQVLTAHLEWTIEQLTAEQREWLGQLPLSHRVSPGGEPARHDLFVTHATPRNYHDEARLCAPGLPAAEAREVFGQAGADTVVFGHHHGHFISNYGDLTLVNVSSTSLTPDGVPAAAYTIATWHDGHWSFEQRRVNYDPTPEVERARTRSLPFHPWLEHVSQAG